MAKTSSKSVDIANKGIFAMSCYWNKARAGRTKALENLAARRMAAELGMDKPVFRSNRNARSQVIFTADLGSRGRTELVH